MADITIALSWGDAGFLIFASGVTLSAVGKWLVDRTAKGADAYTSKKMENLATHQDIQKVVDQVRETERVKADILHEEWDRQQRWTYTRNVYVDILSTLGRMLTAHTVFVFEQERGGSTHDNSQAMTDSLEHLLRLTFVAQLSCSREAYTVLVALGDRLRDEVGRKEALAHIRRSMEFIAVIARQDLGYSPNPEDQKGRV